MNAAFVLGACWVPVIVLLLWGDIVSWGAVYVLIGMVTVFTFGYVYFEYATVPEIRIFPKTREFFSDYGGVLVFYLVLFAIIIETMLTVFYDGS